MTFSPFLTYLNMHPTRGDVVRVRSFLIFDDTMFIMLLSNENVTWHYQCKLDKDIPNCILWHVWNDSRENDIFALFALLKHASYPSGLSQI